MMELSFSGPFVPWNIRSLDRSFPGTFVPKTIRSLEHSFPGPCVPWNFRFLELSFQVPWTFPAADRSCICQPSSIPGLEQRSPVRATVHSRCTQSGTRERFFVW